MREGFTSAGGAHAFLPLAGRALSDGVTSSPKTLHASIEGVVASWKARSKVRVKGSNAIKFTVCEIGVTEVTPPAAVGTAYSVRAVLSSPAKPMPLQESNTAFDTCGPFISNL